MKFPFVWRSTFDEACAHARAQTDYRNAMTEQVVECRRAYDNLFAKYDDLVKAMILPPPVPDTPEPTPEPDLPASVRQAISERAAPGTPAFGQLYAAAAELIANDVEVEDVRRRILIGEKAPI